MHRCIAQSPVAVAINGVGHVISRVMDDVEDDSPLVAAAPWAFEQIDPPATKPKRRRRATTEAEADSDD